MSHKRAHPPLPRLIGALALAAVVSACTPQEPAPAEQEPVRTLPDMVHTRLEPVGPLPATLHGMELMQATTGADAAARIENLHQKDVAPEETYIGHYGTGPSHAMLYVSTFASADEAEEVLEDMSTHIGEGSSGFAHHKTFPVDGTEIHQVLGQGQVHFFFTTGADLSWLGVAPEMARPGLAELLGVAVEDVPPLESLLAVS